MANQKFGIINLEKMITNESLFRLSEDLGFVPKCFVSINTSSFYIAPATKLELIYST